MTLAGYEIDDSLSLPPKHDYGIGLIGCGGIVNYAHLPAYQQHGLNLVACYDQDNAKAVKTAADHGISRVASSLADLLGDSSDRHRRYRRHALGSGVDRRARPSPPANTSCARNPSPTPMVTQCGLSIRPLPQT